MKGHGGQPSLDYPNSMQYFRIAVIGAGAAAPTLPTGALATLSGTSPDFPNKANAISRVAAEIPTRSATGVYTVTIDPSFTVAKILNTPIEVYGVAGVWAAVTSVVGRVITISVFTAGGAAVDLTTSNLLVISCECQDSNT
jgi:hypothetical protein